MRPNHLRSVARPPDEELAPELRSRSAGPSSDPMLEAALARCERGEATGTDELRAWQDGRLHAMLARILGDPDLTARALDRLLVDVRQAAGSRRIAGDSAEDWLFARLRRHAREVEREAGVAPRLQAVTATVEPAVAPSVAETAESTPIPAPPPVYVDPGPVTVNPRLRRHRAPVSAPVIDEIPAPAVARRRWPLLLALWLVAGGVGFALALLALDWFGGAREAALPTPASRVAAVPPAPPATEQARPPAPSPRQLLGEPLADREPPPVAALRDRDPASATEQPQAALGQLRIFVHHGADDADSRELTLRLAGALRSAGAGYVEVKAVPFPIVTASVRYFRADDRPATLEVLAAVRPLLGASGRAAPSTPIDFTDFRPLPRPGTVEIWVPAR
jgi:hypothetical protein